MDKTYVSFKATLTIALTHTFSKLRCIFEVDQSDLSRNVENACLNDMWQLGLNNFCKNAELCWN